MLQGRLLASSPGKHCVCYQPHSLAHQVLPKFVFLASVGRKLLRPRPGLRLRVGLPALAPPLLADLGDTTSWDLLPAIRIHTAGTTGVVFSASSTFTSSSGARRSGVLFFRPHSVDKSSSSSSAAASLSGRRKARTRKCRPGLIYLHGLTVILLVLVGEGRPPVAGGAVDVCVLLGCVPPRCCGADTGRTSIRGKICFSLISNRRRGHVC